MSTVDPFLPVKNVAVTGTSTVTRLTTNTYLLTPDTGALTYTINGAFVDGDKIFISKQRNTDVLTITNSNGFIYLPNQVGDETVGEGAVATQTMTGTGIICLRLINTDDFKLAST